MIPFQEDSNYTQISMLLKFAFIAEPQAMWNQYLKYVKLILIENCFSKYARFSETNQTFLCA
jgi:hypothetical protein